MKQNRMYLVLILATALLLAACGSADTAAGAEATTETAVEQPMEDQTQEQAEAQEEAQIEVQAGFNSGDPNSGTQLALLTMYLEETDQAVTAEQANILLPLWQSLQSTMSESGFEPAEFTAEYDAIAAAMSAGQLVVLEEMYSDPQIMQDLMASLGIQGNMGMGPGGGGRPGNALQGTPMPGEGGGPGGGQGEPPAEALDPEQQATMQAGQLPGGGRGAGTINQQLLQVVIDLLQERAG